MPDDVADRGHDVPRRKPEHVEPITPYDARMARYVSRCDLQPVDDRQTPREEAALECSCGCPLLFDQAGSDGEGDAIGDELEELRVLAGEGAWVQRSDVQDADGCAVGDQWDSKQRTDALVQEDRIEHLRVINPLEDHGSAARGDSPSEALADRDSNALLDFLLDALRGRGDELLRIAIEHENCCGVDLQELAHPFQERVPQVVEVEVRKCRVGDCVDPPELLSLLGKLSFGSR